MNVKELVDNLLTAKCPEEVFGLDVDENKLKELFRDYAKLVFPDTIDTPKSGITIERATRAFQSLNDLNAFAVEKLTANTYGDKTIMRKPIVVTTKKQVYNLTHKLPPTEIANVYSGTDKDGKEILLKVSRHAEDNDLIQNEATHLKLFRSDPKTKDFINTLQLVPEVLDSFVNISGAVNQGVVVFEYGKGESYSLDELLKLFPSGIPLEHTAWMFNRLLGSLEAAHTLDIAHGAILPQNLIIHPTTHKGILTNWDFSVKVGEKLKGTMGGPKCRHYYPAEIFKKQPIDLGLDLYMAAKLFVRMVGGDIISNNLPIGWEEVSEGHRKIAGLIYSCLLAQGRRPICVATLFNTFRANLELIFGPPKWRDFIIPKPSN